MKKILSISLMFCVALGFVACAGEEDDIFSASAADRLNTASDLYSARLTAQPNGWAMQLYPTYDDESPNGAGYLLLCRFKKDGTVDVSGYNWPKWEEVYNQGSTEWVPSFEQEYRSASSYWEVITDNGPVLTFNSYNKVLHHFSDPDFHETGTGFGGDYEFIITEAPADASYMMLKGKKRGTYNLLTPVEVGVDYEEYLTDVRNFQSKMFAANAPTGALMVIGDSIFSMEDAGMGLPSIYPLGADKVSFEEFHPFLITRRGTDYYIRFRDVLEKNKQKVQEFRYDKEKDIFTGVGNEKCYICGDSIGRFFESALRDKKRKFEWSEANASSSVYTDLLSQLKTEFNDKFKFTFLRTELLNNGGVITLAFYYYQNSDKKKTEKSVFYNFDMERKDDVVKFIYTGDFDEKVSYTARTNSASLQTFIDKLQQEWQLKGGETQFDLTSIRLVSSGNADEWLTFSLK